MFSEPKYVFQNRKKMQFYVFVVLLEDFQLFIEQLCSLETIIIEFFFTRASVLALYSERKLKLFFRFIAKI